MLLTQKEFNQIRPLQWCMRNFGNKTYNTLINQTDTQLFWLDFMRLVFAPKFKTQWGITSIASFDQTQPVLLTDDLQLVLPTELETAMYYANNKTAPMRFLISSVPQFVVLIIAIVAMMSIILFHIVYGERIERIIPSYFI